ncbi:uncharacterized protein LOC111629327 [Centruroides sculpturatus]|nr:uncharacterized protein LOC111629327 [Centruroides sculpturatus]
MSVNEEIAKVSEAADEISQDSLYSEMSKLRLKDAVIYYESLLAENNLITSESSTSISREAMLMGEEIYERTMDMLAEKILVTDDELAHENENCDEEPFENVEDHSSSDEYEPEGKKKREVDHLSFDYKIKVVNIAKAHPTWNLQTLQKKGCSRYAWYASKLSDKREIFMNINEVCFPTDLLKKCCSCKQSSFIN